jgi:hypothetical protein
MSIKSNIQDDLQSESSYTKNGTMISCSNHFLRRSFRLYIDGSYTGEGDYRANCDYVRLHKSSKKRLRSFVINQFCGLLAVDYDCSRSTAQNAVTSAFTPDELDALNTELIEDALDLITD